MKARVCEMCVVINALPLVVDLVRSNDLTLLCIDQATVRLIGVHVLCGLREFIWV